MKKVLLISCFFSLFVINVSARDLNLKFCNVVAEDKNERETKVVFYSADIYYKIVRNGKMIEAEKDAAQGGDKYLFNKKEEKLGPRGQRNIDPPNQIGGVSLPSTKDTDEVYISKIEVIGEKFNGDKIEVKVEWDKTKPVLVKHDDVFYIEPYGKPVEDKNVQIEEINLDVQGNVVNAVKVEEETKAKEGEEKKDKDLIDADKPIRISGKYRLRLGCWYSAE
ncbi:hypothetical protein GF322_01935 [Candidatus Dependentiae bacterium]|nr:hypothetical protein [Candidatus Dependentiae bacterium]